MRGLPLEPAARLRRALFPSEDKQFGWRLASVTVSLVSVALIALTLGYRIPGTELPPALLVGLLAAFATRLLGYLTQGLQIPLAVHLPEQ